MPQSDATPVVLLTGFLGSGKTTLLARILQDPAFADTAVLINEFGDVALDHLLVDRIDEEVVVLSSGCLCCTMRGELRDALRGLLERRERGDVPSFGRVVIETTGLADPLPVLATVALDPVLKHHFRMACVITTVDVVNAVDQLDRQPESLAQIAVADRLVLTKADLAAPARISHVETRLREINPDAPMVPSSGWLDAATLFDGPNTAPRVADATHEMRSTHTRQRAPHGHGTEVSSLSLVFDQTLNWTRFALWLSMLLHRHGSNVLRVKGLLAVDGSTTPVVVHGVQHIVHAPEHLADWPDPDDHRSRLVFITRGLDTAAIERSLRAFGLMPECGRDRPAALPTSTANAFRESPPPGTPGELRSAGTGASTTRGLR